jgi:hypothetical protein
VAYNLHVNTPQHPRTAESRSDDGVDVTLIRWMLSLSPAERLEVLQSNIRSLEPLRGAADRR